MTRPDQQLAWIERLRQLRRDRARRLEQECLVASEAATKDRLDATTQLELWSRRRDQDIGDVSNDAVDAFGLTQFAHRRDWMDKQFRRAQLELARAVHCEKLKRTAAQEATNHALRQSIQYEKVVEWRKSP